MKHFQVVIMTVMVITICSLLHVELFLLKMLLVISTGKIIWVMKVMYRQ